MDLFELLNMWLPVASWKWNYSRNSRKEGLQYETIKRQQSFDSMRSTAYHEARTLSYL